MEFQRIELPTGPVQSLVWQGDTLVDLIAGGTRWGLDGSVEQDALAVPPGYTDAVVSPNGRHVAVYEKIGTRGLLFTDGQPVAELQRDAYRAEVFPFPICLWTHPVNGHTLMAHCPEDYRRIEIDDLDLGTRLTRADDRQPADFFHSRLSVNRSGTLLMSDGWVWHPMEAVGFFDLAAVFENPTRLDSVQFQAPNTCNPFFAEESNAAWYGDDQVLMAGSEEVEEDDEDDPIDERGRRLLPPGQAPLSPDG